MLEGEAVTILHICAGWEKSNGAANVARMVAGEQEGDGHVIACRTWAGIRELRGADEVWIHCAWKPCLWWAALWGRRVHWMSAGCYDPVRLRYHGWKKRLAGPIERFCLRRAEVVVATCPAEAEWIRAYEPRVRKVEMTDIRRFFNLSRVEYVESGVGGEGGRVECVERVEGERVGRVERVERVEGERGGRVERVERVERKAGEEDGRLRLLYLGRRHPLKGLRYLEAAVNAINSSAPPRVCLRIESSVFGEEKELVWKWCDVLVLPTLSENLGLVVAEALERGKRVITTDGAPAWEPCGAENFNGKWKSDYGGRLLYLIGYRHAPDNMRPLLLAAAIESLL